MSMHYIVVKFIAPETAILVSRFENEADALDKAIELNSKEKSPDIVYRMYAVTQKYSAQEFDKDD